MKTVNSTADIKEDRLYPDKARPFNAQECVLEGGIAVSLNGGRHRVLCIDRKHPTLRISTLYKDSNGEEQVKSYNEKVNSTLNRHGQHITDSTTPPNMTLTGFLYVFLDLTLCMDAQQYPVVLAGLMGEPIPNILTLTQALPHLQEWMGGLTRLVAASLKVGQRYSMLNTSQTLNLTGFPHVSLTRRKLQVWSGNTLELLLMQSIPSF